MYLFSLRLGWFLGVFVAVKPVDMVDPGPLLPRPLVLGLGIRR